MNVVGSKKCSNAEFGVLVSTAITASSRIFDLVFSNGSFCSMEELVALSLGIFASVMDGVQSIFIASEVIAVIAESVRQFVQSFGWWLLLLLLNKSLWSPYD